MADDIVPELLERIQKEFSEKLKRSAVINRIEKLITEGKATYIEAHEYANKVGEILAQCFRDNISLESLPNGKLYYNIAERIINATLGHNYDLVTTVTAHIQKELNKQAEISIVPQIPVKNQDRINGIIDYVSNQDRYDDGVREYLEAHAKNYTLSVVDDLVRENAKFHYNAGIRAKIIRRTSGHCCDWCANLAGTYDYADVSNKGNDVFRRHAYCKCTTEYISSMGRRENVWTHKTPGSEEDIRIRNKHYEKWEKERKLKSAHPSGRELTQRMADNITKEGNFGQTAKRILTGEYCLIQKEQKYLQHKDGAAQYQQAIKGRKRPQSTISISAQEAQQAIFDYAGKGICEKSHDGTISNIEFHTYHKVIGKYPEGNILVDTKRFAIHYGKRGSHIVPVKEKENG